MQSAFPKSLVTLYGSGERLAKNVSEMTGGRFQIQTYAAGEIVGALQIADAVSSNAIECGQTFSSYYVGKDPTFAFGTVLPFGLNPRQMTAWLMKEGDALLSEFYSKHNLHMISSGNTGVQMGGWFRKPIDKVSDLSGLRMRITGIGATIMQKMGVVAQNIPGGDVYPALERGTIDAAEFSSPVDDEKLGFSRVAPHYHFPGWWDCGTNLNLFVNLQKWQELPDNYKAVLKNAAAEASVWTQAMYDGENPAALRRVVAGGAQLKPFNREILEASLAAAQQTYAEISATNPQFKKIYDSYAAFRRDELLWWQVSEFAYDSFMVQSRSKL
jgi:TRAP-type mannitol/chloroaromatic compound transport system substrate-binding protein